MLKGYAELFYLVGHIFGSFGQATTILNKPYRQLNPQIRNSILEDLRNAHTVCSGVNLPVTAQGLQWAIKQAEPEATTYKQMGEVYRELHRLILYELSSIRFLYVPENRALYYQKRIKADEDKTKHTLLSDKAKKKFARSIEDAEEAANCIALGRYTAAVFHMMRIMERGVQGLGKKLQLTIPVEEKDWGLIGNHINGALKKLPNSTPQEKRIHARYVKAAVYLDNVREAWRNPTMHPKETYTEEEAETAFWFVKQYMEYLATIL